LFWDYEFEADVEDLKMRKEEVEKREIKLVVGCSV